MESLTCTPEHPFFTVGGGWVEAGSLGIGTSIVSRAGPALQVTGLSWKRDQSKELAAGTGSALGGYVVYNLTVEGDHTFFVGNTGGGTWVHNIICYRGASGTPDSMTPRVGQDEDGLSAWDQLGQAGKAGDKIQTIDTSRFQNLTEGDMRADGHYSINPVNPSEMADWMASRGSGNVHPLTQEILDATTPWGKLPR